MTLDRNQLMYKVKQLKEGDTLSLLLTEIKKDIADEIIKTGIDEKDKREALYLTVCGVDYFEKKLQQFVNEFDKSKEND